MIDGGRVEDIIDEDAMVDCVKCFGEVQCGDDGSMGR